MSTDETTSDHQQILKQVEFYFGDNNLPYDKFLWTETRKDDGWVPIATLHSFKRMQRFQPFEEVVAAIKESKELLEVSEDGLKVRRKVDIKIPDENESKERLARTVYVKGLGEENPKSQLEIEEFFNKFGEMNQVRLRRTETGEFKSSVFAEFANAEDAKKFVDQDPKPTFKDQELLIMSKQAYVEMKSEQHNFANKANGRRKPRFNAYKQMRAEENKQNYRNRGRGRGKDNYNNKRRSNNDYSRSKKPRVDGEEGNTEAAEPKPVEAAEPAESKPVETAKPAEAETKAE